MATKRIKLILEMTVPEHFAVGHTCTIVENEFSRRYPQRDVRVVPYNRSVAMQAVRAREGASNGAATKRATSNDLQAILRGGTRLAVPFEHRNEAKALGALWWPEERIWVAPRGVDLEPFRTRGWLDRPAIDTGAADAPSPPPRRPLPRVP